MGCFFACFRIKDDDQRKIHLVSNSFRSKSKDPVVSKKKLASVFLCEENGSPHEQAPRKSSHENVNEVGLGSELKHEAKFLKSIGTLPETPAEIRKASEKITLQSTNDDRLSSNSWPPDTYPKKLDWDEQLDQISNSPTKVHESSGVKKHIDNSGAELVPESVPSDISPSHSGHIHPIIPTNSPYPTPQNLTDEMQTPGTIYPSSLETPRTKKNARIRTQYVYPVLNPMEQLPQREAPRETDSREESPQDKKSSNGEQVYLNTGSPEFLVSSLSQWMKPRVLKDERRNNMNGITERSPSGKSSDADRPIIGLVAAHWNEDEPSHISPKWWDGNGIPNSTNKYKEDQKVSWHATPFEERLEKALSDEKLFPQRKLLDGKPIGFEDEGEESDTAAS